MIADKGLRQGLRVQAFVVAEKSLGKKSVINTLIKKTLQGEKREGEKTY